MESLQMIIRIRHDDLPELTERQRGTGAFDRLKPYKSGTTEPWRQLESIGLSSKSVNCDYTGPVTINIQRGGILNIKEFGELHIIMMLELDSIPDEIRFRFPKGKYAGKDLGKIKQARRFETLKSSSSYASEIKTLFGTNVLPSIKEIVPDCGDSFILNLHYSNRTLSIIDMEYNGVNQ
jgi:hypothetical protein